MSKGKIILILCIALIIVVGIVVCFTLNLMKGASTLEYYDVGGYKVSAITKVVGEKKVSGITSSVKNNVSMKSYTYESPESPVNELATYFTYLAENEGFILDGNEGNDQIGGKAIAHKSVDENRLIILEIYYDSTGYTINISVKAM